MRYFKLVLSAFIVALLSACSSFWNLGFEARGGVSSSLVDYLYPAGEVPPDIQSTIPHLELPLRVGIAFVPTQDGRSAISEATKMRLLEGVAAQFVEREFIEHIEIIPDTYVRSSRGINGMQQVARLYGADVMALVSYDQVATSEDNPGAFLYWTIVGSYLIKATSNEVQTFVDTAVFDVTTARLLFRSPGIDKSTDRSTLAESGEAVRKTRDASFAMAMDGMTQNLATELDVFRERAKEDATVASVEWKPGYGGGSVGIGLLLALLFAGCARPRSRRVSPGARAAPQGHVAND